MTNSTFNNSAASTATILVLTSDIHYLPAKQFVSLAVTSERFQVCGLKRFGQRAAATNLGMKI